MFLVTPSQVNISKTDYKTRYIILGKWLQVTNTQHWWKRICWLAILWCYWKRKYISFPVRNHGMFNFILNRDCHIAWFLRYVRFEWFFISYFAKSIIAKKQYDDSNDTESGSPFLCKVTALRLNIILQLVKNKILRCWNFCKINDQLKVVIDESSFNDGDGKIDRKHRMLVLR